MLNSLFEKIFLINLDHRKDRLAQSMAEFEKHGIRGVVRWEAVNGKNCLPIQGTNPGNTGCILSHLGILLYAREKGYKSILILEDDVEFSDDFNDKIRHIPQEYGLLYLGGSDKYGVLEGIGHPHLVKIREVLCTHAYAVQQSMYDTLIDVLETADAPIDVLYTRIQAKMPVLAFRPKIAWQRESYSDILGKKVFYKSATNQPNPTNAW